MRNKACIILIFLSISISSANNKIIYPPLSDILSSASWALVYEFSLEDPRDLGTNVDTVLIQTLDNPYIKSYTISKSNKFMSNFIEFKNTYALEGYFYKNFYNISGSSSPIFSNKKIIVRHFAWNLDNKTPFPVLTTRIIKNEVIDIESYDIIFLSNKTFIICNRSTKLTSVYYNSTSSSDLIKRLHSEKKYFIIPYIKDYASRNGIILK